MDVLVDLDGTLLDPKPGILGSIQYALRQPRRAGAADRRSRLGYRPAAQNDISPPARQY